MTYPILFGGWCESPLVAELAPASDLETATRQMYAAAMPVLIELYQELSRRGSTTVEYEAYAIDDLTLQRKPTDPLVRVTNFVAREAGIAVGFAPAGALTKKLTEIGRKSVARTLLAMPRYDAAINSVVLRQGMAGLAPIWLDSLRASAD